MPARKVLTPEEARTELEVLLGGLEAAALLSSMAVTVTLWESAVQANRKRQLASRLNAARASLREAQTLANGINELSVDFAKRMAVALHQQGLAAGWSKDAQSVEWLERQFLRSGDGPRESLRLAEEALERASQAAALLLSKLADDEGHGPDFLLGRQRKTPLSEILCAAAATGAMHWSRRAGRKVTGSQLRLAGLVIGLEKPVAGSQRGRDDWAKRRQRWDQRIKRANSRRGWRHPLLALRGDVPRSNDRPDVALRLGIIDQAREMLRKGDAGSAFDVVAAFAPAAMLEFAAEYGRPATAAAKTKKVLR